MSRTIQYWHRCLKTKDPLCWEQYNIYIDASKQKTLCSGTKTGAVLAIPYYISCTFAEHYICLWSTLIFNSNPFWKKHENLVFKPHAKTLRLDLKITIDYLTPIKFPPFYFRASIFCALTVFPPFSFWDTLILKWIFIHWWHFSPVRALSLWFSHI